MKRKLLARLEPIEVEHLSEALREAVARGFDGGEWMLRPGIGTEAATHVVDEAAHISQDAKADTSHADITAAEGDSDGHTTTACELFCEMRPDGGPDLVVTAGLQVTALDAAVAQVSAALVRASGLGADCLNLALPPVSPDGGFGGYQEAMNFAHGLFRQLRFESQAAGVSLALEACRGGCLHSPVELRELIDTAHTWSAGACVDAGRLESEAALLDWVRTLGHRLHSLRLDRRWVEELLADGADSRCSRALREVLDDVGFDRPIVLPADSDVKRLRAALEG